MSKKKNKFIPELRFPEFKNEGEWEAKTLGEVAERIEEKVNDKKLITASISAGTGFVSQAEKFSRDISGAQYKNYIVLNEGEFSYNKGNSKRFPQGCIYKLKEFKQVAVPNAFISFRFKQDFIGDFYQGYFDKNYHGIQLMRFITSGARMDGLLNIKADDFFNIVLPTPSKSEQQKIASCLSSLDEVIEAHSQKLELLKDHKKGLMQNLFPQEGEKVPKFRFKEFKNSGNWIDKKLNEICEVNPPSKSLPEKFVYIDLESVEDGILKQKKHITISEAPSRAQRLLKKADVIFQTVRPYQQNNYYFLPDDSFKYVASTGYAQLRAYESSSFLYQYVHNPNFLGKVLAKCTGSNYPAINSSDLSEITVLIPSKIQEQQKIASCLSALDEIITAQAEILEQLKLHKKGLMQLLLPKTID